MRGASRRAASTGNAAHSLAGQSWHWGNAKCAAANDLSADSTAPAGRGEGQSMAEVTGTQHSQPSTGQGQGQGHSQGSTKALSAPGVPHSIDMFMHCSHFLDEISIKCLNIYCATSQDTSILDHDLPQHQE